MSSSDELSSDMMSILVSAADDAYVGFREATYADKTAKDLLVGRYVEIFWDGENKHFSGKIISYDAESSMFKVKYDGEDDNPFEEDLEHSDKLRIFDGSEEDYQKLCDIKIAREKILTLKEKKPIKRSYGEMAIEAIISLAEKGGSSLVSIRRYILEHNLETQSKQPASFNNLTLKALNTLAADGKVDREKHTYKLSFNFIKSLNKKGIQMNDDGTTSKIDKDSEFSGTAAEHNKIIRQLISDRRIIRDAHLFKHLDTLLPFFDPDNHFFSKYVPITQSIISSTPSQDFTEEILDDRVSVQIAMRGVPLVNKPPILKADLHEHQSEGISWMVHMFHLGMPMILGDQMGLGKTLQTIGLISYLRYHSNQKGPHLIVVPLSVLSNWLTEIERFCPTLRAIRFHGPRIERDRIKQDELNDPQNFDIVVTTFEMLVSESNYFRRKYVWTLVIVDEGHRLKNDKSLLSDRLRSVPALSRIILTGTPLQNNLRELWALLHFLIPEVFSKSTAEYFEEGFDLVKNKIDNVILRKARKMLTLFMLRRIKEQVSIKLPSRKEITILVPLTEQQVYWYKHMLMGVDQDLIDIVMTNSNANNETAISTTTTTSNSSYELTAPLPKAVQRLHEAGESDYKKLMNLLLQLRKICNHTYLVQDVEGGADAEDDIIFGSGKLKMLDRMLPMLKADGHRVLLFSQFTSMLDILEEYCDERGWSYLRLDGSTNRVQRRLDVRRFNAPKSSIFVFLISTRAGGLGLNLASADTVILYDSDWNPQVDLQAMERAHRIGQTKPVRVYRLICRGSVEERMLCRAEKKLFLNAMVAEAGEDDAVEEDEESLALGIGGGSMTKSELASLIRFGANAICDKGSVEVTDKDLATLLERQGRDCTAEISEATFDANKGATVPTTVKSRLDMKEIDLRQLGDLQYHKKAAPSRKALKEDEDLSMMLGDDEKRVRKSRIVMVSGKGTGYGGAVPVLGELLVEPKARVAPVKSNRSRAWTHQSFCCLCGNKRRPEDMMMCAHCPKVFHSTCMELHGLRKERNTFQCPLHKCVACDRSTVSAGGLLFRCLGCLTSFCEDCLPQDEIESFGRCKSLEEQGYFSNNQAYYIKCVSCCILDGVRATGVDGSSRPEVEEEDDIENEEAGITDAVVYDTQNMRVFAEYTPDLEDLKAEKRLQKLEEKALLTAAKLVKAGNKRARPNKAVSVEPASDLDSEEEEVVTAKRRMKKIKNVSSERGEDVGLVVNAPSPVIPLPTSCSLEEALDLLALHPYADLLDMHVPKSPSFLQVRSKVFSGKYRTLAAFVSDVRAILRPLGKSSERAEHRRELLEFFDNFLVDILHT